MIALVRVKNDRIKNDQSASGTIKRVSENIEGDERESYGCASADTVVNNKAGDADTPVSDAS